MSVTKKQLAIHISKKLGLSQKDSLFFVSKFFGFITKNYEKSINIQRFGTFLERKTPKRVGRNPKTKEEFIIKERKKIFFSPSSDLKQNINWFWSGWPDSNRRPPHPQCGALPGCATSRVYIIFQKFILSLLLYN